MSRFEQEVIRPVMSGVMPDTGLIVGYEDIVDLTVPRRNIFQSRILSTTGIIVTLVLVFLGVMSYVIIRRR
jgi:hypothetical protein